MTVIHWPNGGWLGRKSTFEPIDIASGEAYFTSDKGVEYAVRITGKGRM